MLIALKKEKTSHIIGRMEISDFGKKLTERSGILSLMDDLGRPLPEGVTPYPLGGGNPARVEEVERLYEDRMKAMLESKEFLSVISAYDAPQGRMTFLKDIASYFSKRYGWPVSERNIAVTSGSQMSMFFLFNLFSGRYGEGEKHILFPLMPEYVGYADQSIYRNMMRSVPSRLEYYDDHSFKYILDKGAVSSYLDEHDDVGAIAFSRPTNPSGNVLRDDEVQFLSSEAERHGIPLIIDNAYGLPFPSIIFSDAHITWNENIILSMSLSKIGLPSIRTGIVVASEEVIEALSNINAIVSLTAGSFGQALAGSLIASGELERISRDVVMPFYKEKSARCREYINTYFKGTDYYYHRSEGSIFIWLYLPGLRISSLEFYQKLKEKGVVTVPGEYSFYGSEEQLEGNAYPHPHYDKCLRLNYSADDECVRNGIRIIALLYREYS